MEVLAAIWPYVAALLPTVGLLYLFWVLMKHILEGDRRERAAQRQWEATLEDRGRTSAAPADQGAAEESAKGRPERS